MPEPVTTAAEDRAARDLWELEHGTPYRFADWPNPRIENEKAGVYTIWRGDDFLYVGMAGRNLLGLPVDDPQGEATSAGPGLNGRSRKSGLLDRLGSHASGYRSGDRFCIYVFDREILPRLTSGQIDEAAAGLLSLDQLIRDYVRRYLSYRFVVLNGRGEALELERRIQREGLSGHRPAWNAGKKPA